MSDLIFVEEKPQDGVEQPLEPGTTIGREGCDVNIVDPEVSRRHAAIREQNGSLAIEDLGSTNGTFVNGRRITQVTPLKEGDSVRLGGHVWSVRASALADATVVRRPATPAAPSSSPSPPPPPAAPRGDVEPPPEVAPSAIRRVLPTPAPGQAPAFTPPAPPGRGSAATRVEATIACMVIVAVVAIALVVYFATY